MTYYIIYQTTNQINGKFYIGAHKTKDLNDNYLGSGKLLKRAISKHGIVNFKKEILFVFETAEEMFAKEAELVTEEFLSENNTYNLKVGGFGGFDYINSRPQVKTEKRKIGHLARWEKQKQTSAWTAGRSERMKKLHATGRCRYDGFLGMTHTADARKRIGTANAKNKGPKNSQYGTRWAWVANETEYKKVPLVELDAYLNKGYVRGTKLKVH